MKQTENFKSSFIMLVCFVCVAFLCACSGGVSAKWQEQYDLGMKYLLDAEYEEAVLAFTAAIEIEPKLPDAYIGRGDAYIGLSNAEGIDVTDKNAYCDLALEDYMAAIDIKDDVAAYYEKLMNASYDGANIDMERLKELLKTGIEKTGSEELQSLLDIIEMPMGNFKNEDFRYFYELDADGQEEIKNLVVAVSNGSKEEAKAALRNTEAPRLKSGEQLKRIRTYYEGYKIDLYKNIENQTNQAWKAIEIRPKEGKGYYCSISNDRGEDFIIGEFADWNWNGEFLNEFEGDFSYATRGTAENGRICGVVEEKNENGNWEEQNTYYVDGYWFHSGTIYDNWEQYEKAVAIGNFEGVEHYARTKSDGTVIANYNREYWEGDDRIHAPTSSYYVEQFEKWEL